MQLCAKGNNYAAPDCDTSDNNLVLLTGKKVQMKRAIKKERKCERERHRETSMEKREQKYT